MPEWLVEALKNYELTEEQKDEIVAEVCKVGEDHSKVTRSMRPTVEDRLRRYDM